MNISDISIGIPSYNTIDYLKMAYNSLRRYYPTNEILIYDDGSDDGSWEWIQEVKKTDSNLVIWHNDTGKIHGHTKTYNWMCKACRGRIYTIFHSDMVAAPNYLENMLKHWKPRTVVSATRIEPVGIYPPSKEKILFDFGLTFDKFDEKGFLTYVKTTQSIFNGHTTKGIFAPWMISKEDLLAIGGHDEASFAPYPHEDQDMFVRFLLAGYNLVQSWDSFCWHWISRGHRQWAKNGIGNDGSDFKFYESRAARNYIRKWNRWMQNDENRCPILHPVYDLAFDIQVDSVEFLSVIEPWAQKVYVDESSVDVVNRYIEKEQPNTNIDLRNRIYVSPAECMSYHDLILTFDEKTFMKKPRENMMLLNNLNKLLSESELEAGKFELDDTFRLTVNRVADISPNFINVNNP